MVRDPFHQPRVLQAPSNLALSTAREGAATASLGNLGQGLTTLRVKNFFLISDLNLPSFSLQPSPLVLSLQTLVQAPLQLSQPLQALAGCSQVSSEPSPLQAEQPQLSQHFLTAEGFQPSDHRCGSSGPASAPSLPRGVWDPERVSSPPSSPVTGWKCHKKRLFSLLEGQDMPQHKSHPRKWLRVRQRVCECPSHGPT